MPRTVAARDSQDDTVAGKNARAAAGKNARAAVPKKSHDRTVARSIQKLQQPSPCLDTPSPKSLRPRLDDTPNSQISTEDDTAANQNDCAAVAKKSHDCTVARAIRKLQMQKPSPCLDTPSPISAKPRLYDTPTSQISTEDDPVFCTPTAQVKPSLISQDENPIRRNDSMDSAMEALLCLGDDTPPRAVLAQPGPVDSFTPSVLDTPGGEADVSASSSQGSSQDSLATLADDNRENSPDAVSVSSSSQAKEVPAVGSNVEHDEYVGNILDQNDPHRVLLKPATRKPRLYHHKATTYPALMVYKSVDDGVRIVSPGIQWSVDGRLYDVVLIGSLGWRSYKKNTRSHQVRPAGPVYAFVRDVAHVGKAISFTHIRKLHIHSLFTKGKPTAEVDVEIIQTTQRLAEDFLGTHKLNTKSWKTVPTFRFLSDDNEQDTDKQTYKRSSMRIQNLEAQHRVREKLEDKIKELEMADKRKTALAKQAKVDAQKKTRELRKEIKNAVREAMDPLKQSVQRQIKTIKTNVGSTKKSMEQQIQTLSNEVRETLEDKLDVHVQELAKKIDKLASGLNVCNEMRTKNAKRTRQMLDTINQKMKTNNRKMMAKHKKLKKNKRKTKTNENFEPPAPPAPAIVTPRPPPAPAIVTRPPTPMVTLTSDPYSVFASPPNQPRMAPGFGQHYVSPAFASRNFAR